jgi:hypothetical protein
MAKKVAPNSAASRAVVTVGNSGGRGFVIETRDGNRLVLTAAHCLPAMPVAHPWATESRTWRVLALLGRKPSVVAQCCFVDPVVDIAVLGPPSQMELTAEYDTLVNALPALTIGCLPSKVFAELDGWLLALDGAWFHCTVHYDKDGPLWLRDASRRIVGGMSGSPILAKKGSAIGLVSTSNIQGNEGGPNPTLRYHLPGWLLGNAVTKTVRSRVSEDGRRRLRQARSR